MLIKKSSVWLLGTVHNELIFPNCAKQLFLLLGHSAHLFLHTWASPHTPTDGVARIFSLTPMSQLGIELTSAQLYLGLWETLIQDALPIELPRNRDLWSFVWTDPSWSWATIPDSEKSGPKSRFLCLTFPRWRRRPFPSRWPRTKGHKCPSRPW